MRLGAENSQKISLYQASPAETAGVFIHNPAHARPTRIGIVGKCQQTAFVQQRQRRLDAAPYTGLFRFGVHEYEIETHLQSRRDLLDFTLMEGNAIVDLIAAAPFPRLRL